MVNKLLLIKNLSKSHFISYSKFLYPTRNLLNDTRLLTNVTTKVTAATKIKPIKKIAAHKNPKLNLENRMSIYVGPLSHHVRKYKRLALLFCTCGFLLIPSIYMYGKAPIVGAVGGMFISQTLAYIYTYIL